MKTKPITLILTFVICLSGSVFAENQYESFLAVDKIEKNEAEDYCGIPFQNFKDGAVVFYKKNITKTIKANRFRPFDKIEKLGYTYIATLRIQKSKDKDFKYSLYSYATDKEEFFLKELKCVNMNKFTYNNAIANAIWKADFFNKNKTKVGYYEVRLGVGSALIKHNPFVVRFQFFDKGNTQLCTIHMRTSPSYKTPNHKLIKNNEGVEVPFVPNPFSKTTTVNQFVGSFKRIMKN